MKDDGTCYRCGETLGSNAALCWWCEVAKRSAETAGPLAPPLLVDGHCNGYGCVRCTSP